MSGRFILDRIAENARGTLGVLSLCNGCGDRQTSWKILELPWCDNKRFISRIPAGEYEFVPRRHGGYYERYRARWDMKFSVEVVLPGKENCGERGDILLHTGNLPDHTRGCLLIGQHSDVIEGGIPRVTESWDAYQSFYDTLSGRFFGKFPRPSVPLTIQEAKPMVALVGPESHDEHENIERTGL